MFSAIRRCILILSAAPLMVAAESMPETVESSLGDRLEISATPDGPSTPHTVTTCLIDLTGGEPKGFDIRQDQTPRYVTRDHQPVCAALFAGVHQIMFWRASHGPFQPVISLPLDLSGRSEERIWIVWRQDGHP